MTTAIRTVKITWVDASETRAMCLGLDQIFRTDWTDAELIEAAVYYAECKGIDVEKYHPVAEEI